METCNIHDWNMVTKRENMFKRNRSKRKSGVDVLNVKNNYSYSKNGNAVEIISIKINWGTIQDSIIFYCFPPNQGKKMQTIFSKGKLSLISGEIIVLHDFFRKCLAFYYYCCYCWQYFLSKSRHRHKIRYLWSDFNHLEILVEEVEVTGILGEKLPGNVGAPNSWFEGNGKLSICLTYTPDFKKMYSILITQSSGTYNTMTGNADGKRSSRNEGVL